MVGLRWWNQVDDDGRSHWVFEARKVNFFFFFFPFFFSCNCFCFMKPLLIGGYACDGGLHNADLYFQPQICSHGVVSCRLLNEIFGG